MRTFFIAFFLGIFAGSLLTVFWNSPDGFEKLQAAKKQLLGIEEATSEIPASDQPVAEEPSEPVSPSVEEPIFKVKTTEPESTEESNAADDTKEEPSAEEEVDDSSDDGEGSSAAGGADEEDSLESELKEALENGSEAAGTLGQAAKEKAEELTEKAQPYIDEGVDLAIGSAIRAQFKLDKLIDSESLEISVKNREVTLSGEAPNPESKRRAIEVALNTKGVSFVEERITISSASEDSADQ